MLIISYDISDDRLRTNFSKFLKKYGGRLQYSVFEIDNSPRVLENIITQIEGYYKKKFTQADSILIFDLSKQCRILHYGYAKNREKELIIV